MANKNVTRKISIFINGREVENNLNKVGKEIGKLKGQLRNLVPGTQEFINKSKDLKIARQAYANINNEIRGSEGLLKKITKSAGGFLGVFGVGLGIAGIVSQIKSLTTANVALNEAQANVMKTTGYTKDQVDALTESLKKLNTKTPINELLGLAEAGGRLNITGKELEDFVKNTDKAFIALGDSLDGDAAQIGTTLGKIANNFDLDKKYGIGESINKIGSALNQLGASSKASEGPIVDFTTRLAGVSSQAQISLPDIAALGALFDENGQSMEVAASTFNKLLPAIGKDVERFAKIAGINVTEFKKIVEKDAFEALKLVAEGAKSNEQGLVGLSQTLENYGISSARSASIVALLSSKTDRLTELQKISNTAFIEGTSLTNEFNIKNDTLGATLTKIGNTLAAKFTGSGVQVFLKGIADGFFNIIKPAEDTATAFFNTQNNVQNLDTNITPLLKQYDILKGKSTLTKDEQIKLDSIISQISTNIPTAITAFDKYGKAMDISTTAAKEFIEQQKNLLKVQNADAISNAEASLKKYELFLQQLPAKYQKAADGTLLISKTIGVGLDAQTFSVKATEEEIKAYQKRLQIINQNIDGTKALIAQLSGEKTAKQIAAETDTTKPNSNPPPTDPVEGDTKEINGEKYVFKDGNWQKLQIYKPKDPTEPGLTPEDQRIIASKKQLAEFLLNFNNEQEIQKELDKTTNQERDQKEEELRIEMKYQKMAENAGYETTLAAGLEDAKQAEIDKIRQKYGAKKLKDKEETERKNAEIDKKWKDKLLKAEQDLENAKKQAQYAGLDTLKSIFGQKTVLYKIIFGLEKAMAISDIIVNTGKANAQITSNTAIANSKAIAVSPLTAGMPWVAINTALEGKSLLTNNLTAAAQIAGILASTIKEFEVGGYTGYGSSTEIAGLVHKDEYVIPKYILQNPTYQPIINTLEQARTNKNTATTATNNQVIAPAQNNENLTIAINRLINKLEEPLIVTNFIGDNEIQRQKARENKLTQTRNNAKIN